MSYVYDLFGCYLASEHLRDEISGYPCSADSLRIYLKDAMREYQNTFARDNRIFVTESLVQFGDRKYSSYREAIKRILRSLIRIGFDAFRTHVKDLVFSDSDLSEFDELRFVLDSPGIEPKQQFKVDSRIKEEMPTGELPDYDEIQYALAIEWKMRKRELESAAARIARELEIRIARRFDEASISSLFALSRKFCELIQQLYVQSIPFLVVEVSSANSLDEAYSEVDKFVSHQASELQSNMFRECLYQLTDPFNQLNECTQGMLWFDEIIRSEGGIPVTRKRCFFSCKQQELFLATLQSWQRYLGSEAQRDGNSSNPATQIESLAELVEENTVSYTHLTLPTKA